MSQTWFLFSPVSTKEALAVETGCALAVERFLAEHPDGDDPIGELSPGGPIPAPTEAAEAHRRYRLPLPDSILERLATCRSSLAIDRPEGGRTGDGQYLDLSPLQVSIVRYLLQRLGKGLVLFNDYPLLNSNIVLLDLRHHPGAPGFPD